MTTEKNNDSAFRIGAVSRLTGVPADTLRVWERRYGVVEPHRTEGGSRLYSQHDIARLGLIKRLVDSGHAIGTVANLTLEQLEERTATSQTASAATEARHKGPVRLALVGATLAVKLDAELGALSDAALQIAGAFDQQVDFERAAPDLAADVLVVELPTLNDDSVGLVRRLQRRCGARRLVVVYGFARAQNLAQMSDQGIAALRFPVSWGEWKQACCPDVPLVQAQPAGNDSQAALGAPIPARLFDDRRLAMASAASTTIKCECPHHLSDLIISLSRFEQYSAECENRSRDDAALHAYLHVQTARARATLEEALMKVIEVEGISLDVDEANDA